MNNYIKDSKVISTITHFYDCIEKTENNETNKDTDFFLQGWELNLAKAILYEFGEVQSKRVANAILAIVDGKHF